MSTSLYDVTVKKVNSTEAFSSHEAAFKYHFFFLSYELEKIFTVGNRISKKKNVSLSQYGNRKIVDIYRLEFVLILR